MMNTSELLLTISNNNITILDSQDSVAEYNYNKGYETGKSESGGGSYDTGFEDGKNSILNEVKVIEKTVTGKNVVILDDVSSVPHEVSVQLSSDTITDFTGKQVTVYGRNLFDQANATLEATNEANSSGSNYGYKIQLPVGRYTISVKKLADTTGMFIYMKGDGKSFTHWAPYPRLIVENTEHRSIIVDVLTEGYYFCVYNAIRSNKIQAENTFKKIAIQVQAGGCTSSYEPYISPVIYTANAEGKIEGIKNISSDMTFFCKDADLSVSYKADFGAVTEREKQWSAFTENGKRTSCNYALANNGNDETFRPLTDLVISTGSGMFNNTKITNPLDCFKRHGTKLDTSTATNLSYMFSNAIANMVPEISLLGVTAATGIQNLFTSSLISYVERLVFKDDGTTPMNASAFQYMSHLKHIRFGGVNGSTIDFSSCSKLDHDSIVDAFYHLSDSVTNKTITFSLTAVNKAFETSSGANNGSASEEWLALVATKPNWTVSLK